MSNLDPGFLRNGQLIYTDDPKYGEYVLDERGNKMPPLYSKVVRQSDGWQIYDSSQGHCQLCGHLLCNQECIRGL